MLKKTFLVGVLLVLLLNVAGCQQQAGQHGASDNGAAGQITFDYDLQKSDVEYFTKNDSFDVIMQSTPYYMGAQQLGMPAYAQFAELKKSKIAEAEKLTRDLYGELKNFENDLKWLRKGYLDFIETALKEDGSTKKFTAEVLPQFTTSLAQEQIAEVSFEKINTDGLDEFSASSLEYQKTGLALKLAQLYYEDFGHLVANGVQLYTALEPSKSTYVQKALETFDLQMEHLDEFNKNLDAVNKKAAELNAVLKQITTGDYYMARAGVAFMDAQFPELNKKLESLKPSEFLNAKDIEFVKKYDERFVSFANNLSDKLDQVDQKKLLPVGGATPITAIPVARAAFGDYLQYAKDTLKQGVQEVVDVSVQNTEFGWDLVKKGYGEIKDETQQTWEDVKDVTKQNIQMIKDLPGDVVKATKEAWQETKDSYHDTQRIIGVGLDAMGAATKSVFDVGFNLYHGNSMADIADEIGSNIRMVKNNYDTNKSGTKILQTAGEYLKGADELGKEFGKNIAGKLGAEENSWSEWGLGKAGEITSSIFTTFGKGIYKLANLDSTTGDYATGALDVGLSFIGGSKAFVKATQAADGAAGTLDVLTESGLNFLQRTWNKIQTEGIKAADGELLKGAELTGKELMQHIGNALDIDARNALNKTLQATGEALDKEFEKILADGGKAIIKNLTNGAAGSLEEFVATGFENSVKGAADAIKTALVGAEGSIENAINNYVGVGIDDYVKDKLKGVIDGEAGHGEGEKDAAAEHGAGGDGAATNGDGAAAGVPATSAGDHGGSTTEVTKPATEGGSANGAASTGNGSDFDPLKGLSAHDAAGSTGGPTTVTGLFNAPDNGPPPLKDLAGKWGNGEMMVTDVIASDAFKKKAKKEGCDLSEIEKEKGKKQGIDITLKPSGENGGKMIFKTADGKDQTIPFTYENGVIKGTFNQAGAVVNLTMNVKTENGKYVTDGNFEVNYNDDKKGESLKIISNATASKAIPTPAK